MFIGAWDICKIKLKTARVVMPSEMNNWISFIYYRLC